MSWAVEVAFKKPRVFFKKPNKPKVQILVFFRFLFLKIVIVFCFSQSHIKSSEVRTQQFESYRV